MDTSASTGGVKPGYVSECAGCEMELAIGEVSHRAKVEVFFLTLIIITELLIIIRYRIAPRWRSSSSP